MVMGAAVQLWGWDAGVWRKAAIDAGGRLQIDIVDSALPAGAATAAHQVTTHGYIDGIETLLGAGLPATLDGVNLRVKEASPIAGFATSAKQDTIIGHIDGIEGLLAGGLPAALGSYGLKQEIYNDNNPPNAWASGQTDALGNPNRLAVAALLAGFNGSTWDRLRTESASAYNLRVKLYDGANGINSDTVDATFAASKRGIHTIAALYGFDGTTLSRLKVQDSTNTNLRIAIYDAANVVNVWAGGQTDALGNPNRLAVAALLAGLNTSSQWDRLRTYGTGILKVGRAKVGLSNHVGNADATVKASAGEVYWITVVNQDAVNEARAVLRDGGAAGTIRWLAGLPPGAYGSFHAVFDPPIEFTTDIYVDVQVGGGGTLPYVIIGYL